MATTEHDPAITRAAERYLEQYGEPLVMNTYLKVAVLALSAVSLMLGTLAYKSQAALASMHPMVMRIDELGHTDAIDWRASAYKPQEVENKYYLARWTTLYFERNRYTIMRDQTQSLYFLNGDVQHAVIQQEQQDKTISSFRSDISKPYVDVDVKSIELDGLSQSPYTARITFDKVFTDPASHQEEKRERWIANVTYVFADSVKNEALSVNPLGMTIVRFRADQAFE